MEFSRPSLETSFILLTKNHLFTLAKMRSTYLSVVATLAMLASAAPLAQPDEAAVASYQWAATEEVDAPARYGWPKKREDEEVDAPARYNWPRAEAAPAGYAWVKADEVDAPARYGWPKA